MAFSSLETQRREEKTHTDQETTHTDQSIPTDFFLYLKRKQSLALGKMAKKLYENDKISILGSKLWRGRGGGGGGQANFSGSGGIPPLPFH